MKPYIQLNEIVVQPARKRKQKEKPEREGRKSLCALFLFLYFEKAQRETERERMKEIAPRSVSLSVLTAALLSVTRSSACRRGVALRFQNILLR
jgi:hypothetical protein